VTGETQRAVAVCHDASLRTVEGKNGTESRLNHSQKERETGQTKKGRGLDRNNLEIS